MGVNIAMSRETQELMNYLYGGIKHLEETLTKPGDILRINEHQFWIRLTEKGKYFDHKFYKIDTQFRLPRIGEMGPPLGHNSHHYLVYLQNWDLPKVAFIEWSPAEDVSKGGHYFDIHIQKLDAKNPQKDESVRVPITKDQMKKNKADWCIGQVFDSVGRDSAFVISDRGLSVYHRIK